MIGIYKIRNRVNGKEYIGSSVRILRRFRDHKYALRRGEHKNKKLQNAWNKHGEHAFEFCVVMLTSKDMLRFYEQRFLDQMQPAYNLNPIADKPPKGGRRNPSPTGRKGGRRKGFTQSQETKDKIRAAIKALGMIPPWRNNPKPHPQSAETRKKISDTLKRKGIQPPRPSR